MQSLHRGVIEGRQCSVLHQDISTSFNAYLYSKLQHPTIDILLLGYKISNFQGE